MDMNRTPVDDDCGCTVVLLPANSARLYTLVSEILDHLEHRRQAARLPVAEEDAAIKRAVDALNILDNCTLE